MSTKQALRFIRFIGILIPVFFLIGMKTGSTVFFMLAGVCSFTVLGLLVYAWVREQKHGDKSESIPSRATTAILLVVGLWIAFIVYHAIVNRGS